MDFSLATLITTGVSLAALVVLAIVFVVVRVSTETRRLAAVASTESQAALVKALEGAFDIKGKQLEAYQIYALATQRLQSRARFHVLVLLGIVALTMIFGVIAVISMANEDRDFVRVRRELWGKLAAEVESSSARAGSASQSCLEGANQLSCHESITDLQVHTATMKEIVRAVDSEVGR